MTLSRCSSFLTVMALNQLNLLRPLLCQSLVRHVRSPLVAASRVSAPLLHPNTTCYPAACTRLYATKKAKGQWGDWTSHDYNLGGSVGMNVGSWLDTIRLKYESPLFLRCFSSFPLFLFQAKAKGQSAKVNINSALVEDIISLDEVKEDMAAVLNALKDDFARNLSIRTSPGIQLISVSFFDSPSCCLPACLPLNLSLCVWFSNFTPYCSKLNSYHKSRKDAQIPWLFNLSLLTEEKEKLLKVTNILGPNW